LPELERPYEKLEWHGQEALSNAELLAIIIKTGTKEETSVQLAQKVLNIENIEQEGINFLRNISLEELMQIKRNWESKSHPTKSSRRISKQNDHATKRKKTNHKKPTRLS